jgi:hypothetical protein
LAKNSVTRKLDKFAVIYDAGAPDVVVPEASVAIDVYDLVVSYEDSTY